MRFNVSPSRMVKQRKGRRTMKAKRGGGGCFGFLCSGNRAPNTSLPVEVSQAGSQSGSAEQRSSVTVNPMLSRSQLIAVKKEARESVREQYRQNREYIQQLQQKLNSGTSTIPNRLRKNIENFSKINENLVKLSAELTKQIADLETPTSVQPTTGGRRSTRRNRR